ncbi:stage III sporulation protein AB [Clostridium novyi B str. ATCC 27606]|uniref:Stage III sporulation protein AB n=3 Tax=Clostridium TaxID=1485 RepID=A0AA40IUX6_CLONO|nr:MULTISPECIES: stage III sporulation protein SpoIIIAB [Clostridium]KEI14998.1 stage III sporulation protein AB [Clostridium novyi B str. NCTC 9691]KEI16903.1 stage III sporulation protein AB [Clostridium novyi B str. ATCC 27606]KEI17364.1 stage III sporulation protein AB [Clostridium haemolyticum NCTC 9693]KGN03679.1 stage III sporulation protein AB [Clostridium haemolyticum NCTC 8350]CAG7840972.1 Stage III sporulation protein AB [Clostridium haemolyticum]
MYLKILGCALVLISSSLLGFIYGQNLKKRFFQLKEIEQAVYQLKNEMLYSHNSLPDIFNNVSEKCDKPICDIFKEISKLLYDQEVESVYEAFKKSLINNSLKLNLKKYDIDIILNLSKSLGESDIDGQQSMLTLTLRNINSQLDSAEKVMQKNIKMYRYLGFSLGAILVIMML